MGSGNHFIEINELKDDNQYMVVVHSGSRGFGNRIATYFQNIAIKENEKDFLQKKVDVLNNKNIIKQNRKEELAKIKQVPLPLSYLEETVDNKGRPHFNIYLKLFNFAVGFAYYSRIVMLGIMNKILKDLSEESNYHYNSFLKFYGQNTILDSVHNTIDFSDEEYIITRKGATDASSWKIIINSFKYERGDDYWCWER